ncbi:CopD family protein [Acidisoma sp. 7E03]
MPVPDFDLSDSGGIGLVLLRALCDLAVLTVFGTATLRALIRLAAVPAADGWAQPLRRGNQALAALAGLLLVLWLVFTARYLAEAAGWRDWLGAIVTVLAGTSYGAVVIGQVGALALMAAALFLGDGFGDALALLAAALAVGLQACHGHAFSMGQMGLYAVSVLHLLGGGAWLGSLPALWWMTRRLPPEACARLLRHFSSLGQVAVLLIAVTALIQGLTMIQNWHTLVTTAYGWTAALKGLLFLVLLGLAAANRVLWTPRLARGAGGHTGFALTLGIEIGCGMALILAAGLLASLPPVMSM